MKINFYKNYLAGSLNINVIGNNLSEFINEMYYNNIELRDVKYTNDNTINLNINIDDFKLLCKIAKQYHLKVKIKKKIGMPFINWRLKRRYMFLFGVIFFLLFTFLMSGFIWDINIIGQDGNSLTYEQETLLKSELNKLKIYEGVWKYNIPTKDIIQKHLREQVNEQFIWVGIEFRGTTLNITAVPNLKPDLEEKFLIPSNLIADKKAMITKVLVYEGIANVREGDMVYPGQILVSGRYDEQKKIAATGVVEGIVWYTVDVEIPLTREVNTYVGEYTKKIKIKIGKWVLPINFSTIMDDSNEYKKQTVIKQLSWRNINIPIHFIIDKYYKISKEQILISEDEARSMAINRAIDRISDQSKFLEVVSKTIMKYNVNDNIYYMKILIESLENIASRQIIAN